jgi:hypothetical protein
MQLKKRSCLHFLMVVQNKDSLHKGLGREDEQIVQLSIERSDENREIRRGWQIM